MFSDIKATQTFALCVFSSILAITGCSTNYEKKYAEHKEISDAAHFSSFEEKTAVYIDEFNEWKGTPYRIGGTTKAGVDCSSFVQSVFYSATNKLLPRTTSNQVKVGFKVAYESARTGDLVFFRTSEKTNHVGIYLGKNAFMHASTSKGVIISRLDNPYWSSVFWQMRRVD